MKFSTVSVNVCNQGSTLVSIKMSGKGYYSDKIYLSSVPTSLELYELSANWNEIRSDIIRVKNGLRNLRDDRSIILKDMRQELSPYLLATKL